MTQREKPGAGNAGRQETERGNRSRADGGVRRSKKQSTDDGEAARNPGFSSFETRARPPRVALVALDGLDREALFYALNACQRMDARLDVLTDLSPEETDREIIAAHSGADTPWRVIPVGENAGIDIVRYARNEPELLFLISGAGNETTRRLRGDSTALRPGVPWVEVEGKSRRR